MPVFCYDETMDREIIKYPHIHGVVFAERGLPTDFPAHWHNEAEFLIIRKKGCRYKIGDTVYAPEPGDILLIWPRELHEIIHIPKDGEILIQFSSDLLESNSDLLAAGRFLNEYHHISTKKEPDLTGRFLETIGQIRDMYSKNLYFMETRCKLLIYELLILLGEHAMQGHRELIGGDRFSDRSWEYVRMACDYISDHSSEDISQTEVAAHTGLSPYYFSKLFNEYTKMTFPAYLSAVRVQKATHLLADMHLSVTECAFLSGFQSTTTFNKAFHELTGHSPREYRKMRRQNR